MNILRQIWSEGRTSTNGWIAIPSVLSAEALAAAKWDSITIDMQHGTADYSDLLYLLPIIEKSGAVPMVRVPWLDEASIMRALDVGALGIIAPMIETAADARRLVAACLYPPDGGRSFGPIRARLAWGDDYGARANAEVVPFAMIETKAAVANLDEILETPGLGGVYIGPADLAFAYGYKPHFDRTEPDMLALIARIREACAKKGLPCGLHCGDPAYAARMAGEGFSLVTIASDARFLEAGARAALSTFKSASQR
ncbi:HpcH/HpaI aldolase/citrate lyase family protein [Lacibacterium aquatile]|uniref:HpcH/HpaI aldolase/citrate lyase family protein n=1 Tax=Lacibacterium aquatile TaxID=1168082 RepID=A0ABW5DQT7_9PROT